MGHAPTKGGALLMPRCHNSLTSAPWVLVCGGFHQFGGMDRANYELAKVLLQQGRKVSLVSHKIDPELATHPQVEATIVRRPFDSILLGERSLRREGMRVASEVTHRCPDARVVVNGGNCEWPDINWVHSVHAAWPRFDDTSPLWFRAKSAVNKGKARRDERRALSNARLVIANSQRTSCDLIALGIPAEIIRTIYLGCDPSWQPATEEQKLHARRSLELPASATVISFVGALGYDRNKGFDTLLTAWRDSSLRTSYLLVAGGGRGLNRWRNQIRQSGFADRVRLLGFTERVADVYNASDLMVSPVRYEAFGLNVQEAICRGVPAILSASAGVAEVYPPSLTKYLLQKSEDPRELATILSRAHQTLSLTMAEFSPLAAQLRARTWHMLAEEFIAAAEASSRTEAEINA